MIEIGKFAVHLREVPCLILVGGLGTRLRAVVRDIPKPMAPIAGKPFLEYLVRWVRRSGVTKLAMCVGHRAESIQQYFQDGRDLGLDIKYAVEDRPLGTWGAIRQAAEALVEPFFFVLNGDSWLDVELNRLLHFHAATGAVATIAAAEVNDCSRFGTLQADSSGAILGFHEKSGGEGRGMVNGGVYVFSREMLSLAPAGASSLEQDVFPKLVGRGLYAMPVRGYFVDIGVPDEYLRLQNEAEGWICRMGVQDGGQRC